MSSAIGKAADDLYASRAAIDQARADIPSRNTSVSRDLVASSGRVIERLKDVDEALRDTLKELAAQD